MGTLLIICITVIISVYILSHAHVRITITRKEDTPFNADAPGITEDDVEKAYEDMEKDPAPTFENVISVINKEFGGVDYEE